MLILDAYNVLHVTGVLPPHLAGVGVRGLAELIATSRWRSLPCRLVCDGTGEKGVGKVAETALPRSIRVIYAGPGRDADTLIENLIDASTSPRRLVIVSSDRRLRAAARRRRCRWLASDAFLETIAHDCAPSRTRRGGPRPPEADVARWMREFGFEPGETGADDHSRVPRGTSPPAATGRTEALDEGLREEIEREWPGRVDPDDLDMTRWIDPDPTKDEPPPSGG